MTPTETKKEDYWQPGERLGYNEVKTAKGTIVEFKENGAIVKWDDIDTPIFHTSTELLNFFPIKS